MRCCKMLSAAAVAFGVMACHAQDARLFNVTLGTSEDAFPACDSEEGRTKICLYPPNRAGTDQRYIELRPDKLAELKTNLMGQFVDGKLESILVETRGAVSQESLLARLTTAFGKPSQFKRVPLQNAFGMQILSIEAVWVLRKTSKSAPVATVIFQGVSDRLDAGYIDMSR